MTLALEGLIKGMNGVDLSSLACFYPYMPEELSSAPTIP